MRTKSHFDRTSVLMKVVLLAGLSGGLAEILWVQLYSSLAGQSSVVVAREVVASLSSNLAQTAAAPEIGVAIHLVLSVFVAWIYARLVWLPFMQRRGPGISLAVASGVLACIWAINFLLLLPLVNATFISLLPYSVTLGSKLLFGAAMAGVFQLAQSWRPAASAGLGRENKTHSA